MSIFLIKKNQFFTKLKELKKKINLLSLSSNNYKKFKKLSIYNTFLKEKIYATASGHQIYVTGKKANNQSNYAKVYICGPTVYDDSHIGHALTYIRFDLFKRVLINFCSTNIFTIMNITDIDDKIIKKANESNKSCKEIADIYLISFLDDLKNLNILKLDTFIRVSDHIDLIINFIKKLELNGYTYIDKETNDVLININKIQDYPNFMIETNKSGKISNKDFVLWKSYKENEPYWYYPSEALNKKIKGRPGWHVECSAICNHTLGNKIDFHLGGKDLYFPHHVNEASCFKAFIQSMIKEKKISIHSWSNIWIHFGKLLVKNDKMSKSLKNFISIKDFLNNYHCNLLRLVCIIEPLRKDITYNENFLNEAKIIDTKIQNFILFLNEKKKSLLKIDPKIEPIEDIHKYIDEFNTSNLEGIADNFNLSKGLHSLLDIIEKIKQKSLTIYQLVIIENLLKYYLDSMGLSYSLINENENENYLNIINQFIHYRKDVRNYILDEIINKENLGDNLKLIIKQTDNLREDLKKYQISISDEKFVKKK